MPCCVQQGIFCEKIVVPLVKTPFWFSEPHFPAPSASFIRNFYAFSENIASNSYSITKDSMLSTDNVLTGVQFLT